MSIKESASVPGTAARDGLRRVVSGAAGRTVRRLAMPQPHAQAVAMWDDADPGEPLPVVVPIGDYALTVDPAGNLAAVHLPTGTRSVLMSLPVPDPEPTTTTQDGGH